ncbi:variant erythrocyte surface antigen beta subunit, putative [Babesia ovis]|uniref:Variant erythrocyte surface antigen beta subunit, putative n=1 Tax=Babesia ovis TaxID=5869 RepID=A0A9W5WWH0_BABOV|nr:variant erythrocyte surface antigen beta subunit, putative [Babesia ovis]
MSEGSVTIRDSLLNSPTNLKEAIDWILRVTNKDGQGNGEEASSDGLSHCLCPLSQAVVTVLRDVRVKEYIGHGSRNRNSNRSATEDSSDEELALVQDILSSIETIGGVRTTRNLIQDVASKLAEFIGWDTSSGNNGTPQLTGKGIGCNGKGTGGTKCSHTNCFGYQSSYGGMANLSMLLGGDDTGTTGTGNDWTILAKIFLGTIPFIFSGLSYMYWACNADGSAGREGFKNSDTVNNESQVICHYLKRMGFETTNGLKKDMKVQELKDAIKASGILTEGESKLSDSFAEYLEAVRSKVRESVKENGAKAPLLKLNILCTGYFRALNQPYRVHRRNHRLPRTIREILYWLSCVQYCPVFRVLVQKMQELCQRVGNGEGITFYSKNKKCEITPANSVSYFLSAALVAPMVLLSIQDTIQSLVPEVVVQQAEASEGSVDQSAASLTTEALTEEQKYHQRINEILKAGDNKVFIHDLYANSLFEFRFPMSETESYYLLQDCLVALYYQLYFLKQQCNFHRIDTAGGKTPDGFDWTRCRYGDKVNCNNISGWKCSENKGKNEVQKQCGKDDKHPSPLQAFLTDCLPGFSCEKVKAYMDEQCKGQQDNISKHYSKCYPEFLEHRQHAGNGQYCPIPMGFSGSFKKKSTCQPRQPQQTPVGMSGLGINGIVMYYANDDLTDSCLYQLTRCICSLTRRVPRSTGTLFGFFHGLGHVLFHRKGTNGDKDVVKNALDDELQLATFGLQGSVTLMEALMEWKTKTGSHSKPGDCCSLDSLSSCSGGSNQVASASSSCGAYLHPLTGSLYNSVATQYCDTYLSWILYLSGRLQDGLKALRDAFLGISCKKSGCKKANKDGVIQAGQQCECTSKGCKKGNHGDSNKLCCCWSVVHCAGVYSVFYRFGFSYVSPFGLSGRVEKSDKYTSPSKRTCSDFYKQLETVINGTLFTKTTVHTDDLLLLVNSAGVSTVVNDL